MQKRYQELREGRAHLENAIAYIKGQDPIPVLPLIVLYEALASVKAELAHPERFNTDGTPKLTRMYDSTNGPARGAFPPTDTNVKGISRQVRRWIARTLGFSQMSFPRVTQANQGTDEEPKTETVTGRSPMVSRSERRRIAKKARINKPEETTNENSGI